MDTNTKRTSNGIAIFAAVALFTALLLAAYFLYGSQFTEQDISDDMDRQPTQDGNVTATFAPTGTLQPTPTQLPTQTSQPTTVPPTATVAATQAPPNATATPETEAVTIYMVALGDNGASGPATGCGDSLVSVSRTIPFHPTNEARIAAALVDLFSHHDQTFAGTPYYNALYQSELAVNSVRLEAGVAIVELTGNILVNDDCDDSRVEGQIEQTILQFADVSDTQVFLNGVPLEVALTAQ